MTAREEFKEWVKALRSGEYVQGKEALTMKDYDEETNQTTGWEHCCLGVKCDLSVKAGRLTQIVKVGSIFYGKAENASYLPDEETNRLNDGTLSHSVTNDLKFKPADLPDNLFYLIAPIITDESTTDLATLNDKGASFYMIADIIEAIWLRSPVGETNVA